MKFVRIPNTPNASNNSRPPFVDFEVNIFLSISTPQHMLNVHSGLKSAMNIIFPLSMIKGL